MIIREYALSVVLLLIACNALILLLALYVLLDIQVIYVMDALQDTTR